jgi:hypothetical protein
MLIVVKLVDVMMIPLAQSTRDTAFPLKDDSARVVNKVSIFSLISDRCDIFVACLRLHKGGTGILKIGKTLSIGTGTVHRVLMGAAAPFRGRRR